MKKILVLLSVITMTVLLSSCFCPDPWGYGYRGGHYHSYHHTSYRSHGYAPAPHHHGGGHYRW